MKSEAMPKDLTVFVRQDSSVEESCTTVSDSKGFSGKEEKLHNLLTSSHSALLMNHSCA